jgi:hypothetical protein
VILDSRPVHAAIPHTEAIRDAQRKKPKVPVHAVVTANHPMVRFIGSDDMAQNSALFAVWLPSCRNGNTPRRRICFCIRRISQVPGTGRYALGGFTQCPAEIGAAPSIPTAIFSFLICPYHSECHLPKKGVCMVSALYAVLGALLLIKFSFDVVRLRMQYRVAYGDGGFSELQSAIRIHGNAVEYIPVALVLLLFMEMNGADVDGASLRADVDCRTSDALLRIPPPAFPLAPFRHERNLVFAVANGAGESLVYALGVGFPCISAQYATSFFPDFYVMSHRDTLFSRLSPVWATDLDERS